MPCGVSNVWNSGRCSTTSCTAHRGLDAIVVSCTHGCRRSYLFCVLFFQNTRRCVACEYPSTRTLLIVHNVDATARSNLLASTKTNRANRNGVFTEKVMARQGRRALSSAQVVAVPQRRPPDLGSPRRCSCGQRATIRTPRELYARRDLA